MPALSLGHQHVVLSGTFQGGEQWATGFSLLTAGVGDITSTQAAATAIAGVIVPGSGLGQQIVTKSTAACTLCTVYTFGSDPKHALYVGQAPISGVSGSAGIPHPNQCSAAITLLTGAAGASRRGRMFLPLNGLSVSNGKIGAGDLAAAVAAAKTTILAINGGTGGYSVAVRSITKGWIFPVTNVQLGDVYDTQERRRDKLVETRTTLSIP